MRGAARGAASASRSAVFLLILLPGLALGYVGLRALAEREHSLRTNYTATTVLVRDRLAAELTLLESDLDSDLSLPERNLEDPAAVSRWLTTLRDRRPWLDQPFLIRKDGALAVSGLVDGWPRRRPDPIAGLPRLAAVVQAAEAAEFQQGDLEEALRRYRRGLALTTPSAAEARALLLARIGRTQFKLRRLEAGIEAYRSVLDQGAGIIAPNGLPYTVIALLQLGDGFEALDLGQERAQCDRRLLQYVVEHPWDLQDGYGHYLARARRSAPAGGPLAERARTLADAVAMAEWIRERIQSRLEPGPEHGSAFTRVPARWALERGGQLVLVGTRPAGPRSPGTPTDTVGYEIRTDYIRGPMLSDILKTVDLGGQLRIAVVPAPGGALTATTTPIPLAVADLNPVVPGLHVALVHEGGRSMDQLVVRERWAYGTLIVGMVTVMLVGVGFALRASARATELSRLKSEFVSNVSHELKTPLALIRLFGETLESGIVRDEPRRQEYYGIIRRESERLTHLIDNVLDIGRIDSGTKQYSIRPDDLTGAVQEALAAYRPMFDRLGFQIVPRIHEGPIQIPMDRDAIVRAIINLFQNAIKYSGERRYLAVSVEVRGDAAAISVEDHGTGIARGELARIFDPYYRIATNQHTASPGSGLGLAIVRHTIAAHGGRIDVDSAVGEGSVFTLMLPLVHAAPATAQAAAPEAAGA